MQSQLPPGNHVEPDSFAELGNTEMTATEATRKKVIPDVPLQNQIASSVRVEGLAETLLDVRHELALISNATKYNWINQRLILLRNALIALSILVVVIVAVVACYREAYRQTLTIAAFDVPAKMAEQGLTGQVVAKALFDELIKRRELVTTLEAGELKGAWAENRADVAIPEAKFTLQSVFRYLRYMTGNEIAVDGEIILDGEKGEGATMKVRVAGKPPTVVNGAMRDWQTLVGQLASGVLEVTQPAVLAGYMGAQAKTPEDLAALSKHIVKMQSANNRPSAAVMSVAYDAYGSALQRQGKTDEAQAAFAEAMALDSTNGVAVNNAANTQNALRNYAEASALYKQAQGMRLPDTEKGIAFQRRITSATNAGDCLAGGDVLREAKASPHYNASVTSGAEAIYVANCEFEEARAVALIAKNTTLHPDAFRLMNALGLVQIRRPEKRYLDEGIKVFRTAIANGIEEAFVYANLAVGLAEKGEYGEAKELFERAMLLRVKSGLPAFSPDGFAGTVNYLKGEYANADAALRRFYATAPMREEQQFAVFAATQAGLQRFEEATAIYNDGLTRLPKSCQLWAEFGRMYATNGDIATALATFDKGIAAVPKCGLNYNAAARLLIKQNRVSEAKQKLDALIKAAPNSDGAVIAKEMLASIGAKS
jgi:tetratricopeptide (TPR) repeat protein